MAKQGLTLDEFWSSIEEAWAAIPNAQEAAEARAALADPAAQRRGKAAQTLNKHTDAMLAVLRQTLSGYTSAKLSAWDAHCERLLYDIDREDVHEVLDGSDDGFLYARGFVVAAGRSYYNLVNTTPEHGIGDAEEESMCYLAAHLHNELFGEWPPTTGISRETASNPQGWS